MVKQYVVGEGDTLRKVIMPDGAREMTAEDELVFQAQEEAHKKVVAERIARLEEAKRKDEMKANYYDRKRWFDKYFSMQLDQHAWQTDYKPSHDDYFNCDYADWSEVVAKANEVRAEIKALEAELK